jgi:hypothetical protein
MAEPLPPSQVNTIYSIAKDFALPSLLAIISLAWNLINQRKTNAVGLKAIELKASLDDINSQRHWRREKIYHLADELNELATDYWLSGTEDHANKKRAIKIRAHLHDIEENSQAIQIDITNEIKDLQNYITGGDFESSSRTALDCSHHKFLQIHITTQKIKSKLS